MPESRQLTDDVGPKEEAVSPPTVVTAHFDTNVVATYTKNVEINTASIEEETPQAQSEETVMEEEEVRNEGAAEVLVE